MGILGSEYQWAHLEWCRPRIPWSQLKRKGGRGVVGRPLPTKRGITSGMGYTRAATGFQVINNPCLYQGHRHLLGIPGHQCRPAVKWSSTIPRLYQVINIPLFIPGHQHSFVYTRSLVIPCLYQVIGDSLFIPGRSELFTPVAVVWGALLWPKYSRGAIPGPFACVAPGRARSTPVGRFWAASFLQLSRLQDVHNGKKPFRTT